LFSSLIDIISWFYCFLASLSNSLITSSGSPPPLPPPSSTLSASLARRAASLSLSTALLASSTSLSILSCSSLRCSSANRRCSSAAALIAAACRSASSLRLFSASCRARSFCFCSASLVWKSDHRSPEREVEEGEPEAVAKSWLEKPGDNPPRWLSTPTLLDTSRLL